MERFTNRKLYKLLWKKNINYTFITPSDPHKEIHNYNRHIIICKGNIYIYLPENVNGGFLKTYLNFNVSGFKGSLLPKNRILKSRLNWTAHYNYTSIEECSPVILALSALLFNGNENLVDTHIQGTQTFKVALSTSFKPNPFVSCVQ